VDSFQTSVEVGEIQRSVRNECRSGVKFKSSRIKCGVVGTGWSWLRIGTGGGHLWVR
jgi:hypothetical protein